MAHPYSKIYLSEVMENIAALFDIAVNVEGIDADVFSAAFSNSEVARGIEGAFPDMLAGKSAADMLDIILSREKWYNYRIPEKRSPEYWAGWILAAAQWKLNRPFSEILSAVPMSKIISMYYPYHEADEQKTVDIIKAHLEEQKMN